MMVFYYRNNKSYGTRPGKAHAMTYIEAMKVLCLLSFQSVIMLRINQIRLYEARPHESAQLRTPNSTTVVSRFTGQNLLLIKCQFHVYY